MLIPSQQNLCAAVGMTILLAVCAHGGGYAMALPAQTTHADTQTPRDPGVPLFQQPEIFLVPQVRHDRRVHDSLDVAAALFPIL